MERVLITGPDGFVGYPLCERLLKDGFAVRGAQYAEAALPEGCESVVVGDLATATNWKQTFDGVDRVVHLAARVHVMDDREEEPLAAFRHVNVEGTRKVAAAAVEAGVKRFVFVSTVKVLGEAARERPFRADDEYAPEDPYGISKMEAEQLLKGMAAESDMEVAIVRPTLVYGSGVRANFLRLLSAVNRGLPLPFGLVHNRRSLVGVGNLVDLLTVCLTHPNAGNETFMASDGQDLSTADLVRKMAEALGRKPRLLPVPPTLMRMAGKLLGKGDEVERLLGSLTVDIAKNKELLGWTPPVSVEEGMGDAGCGVRDVR